MVKLGEKRRELRLNFDYSNVKILSDRTYNLILGLTVLYGILINVIICFIFKNTINNINPILSLIGYVLCCVIGIFMSSCFDDPFISFIGYNLVVLPVGFVLSSIVKFYDSLDSQLVFQSFLCTSMIVFCMILLSILYPKFFSKIGWILFISFIGLIFTEFIFIFFDINQSFLSFIFSIIFSLYIGRDFYRSQQYPKTLNNAIDCSLDIYLDVINLFINILDFFGHKKK